MTYNCFNCRKKIEIKSVKGRVICPYCGSRILVKSRRDEPKSVKAR